MGQQTAMPEIAGLTYVKELGVGGYAHVYLYELHEPRMEVAVKVLDVDGLGQDARRQFTEEADKMAKIAHHPHIVQVFRVGEADDGRPYIVMKYYPRQNYGVRAKSERFPVAEVLRTGVQIACAVETAHRAGILHRDIKPANILADQYGSPALTDFGIATAGDQDDGAEGLSIPWAPPEATSRTRPQTVRSDVYSLAATLWTLLVGRSPFEVTGDNSPASLIRRIESTPPPQTGRADVPVSLERLLQMGMSKSPDNRPASAVDFARALQSIEQEQHLPVTRLVLEGDEPIPPSRSAAAPGIDETNFKAPKRIEAQPETSIEAPVPPSRTSPPADDTVRRREPRDARPPRADPAPVPDGTIRVQRGVATDEPKEGKPRNRKAWLAGGLAAAIAVAVAGAIVLSGGGKSDSPPETNQTQTHPQVFVGDSAPGTPVVHATRVDPRHIVFRWSGYSGEEQSDSYRWRQSGTGTPRSGVSTAARLAVTTAKNAEVCLAVQVIRADGSTPSALSDVTCSR